MEREDQTDRCTMCPDRLWGMDLRPLCKKHDDAYDAAETIFEKLFGDVVFVFDIWHHTYLYCKKYSSESESALGRAVRNYGIWVAMPVSAFFFGLAALFATMTVGSVRWAYQKHFKK